MLAAVTVPRAMYHAAILQSRLPTPKRTGNAREECIQDAHASTHLMRSTWGRIESRPSSSDVSLMAAAFAAASMMSGVTCLASAAMQPSPTPALRPVLRSSISNKKPCSPQAHPFFDCFMLQNTKSSRCHCKQGSYANFGVSCIMQEEAQSNFASSTSEMPLRKA